MSNRFSMGLTIAALTGLAVLATVRAQEISNPVQWGFAKPAWEGGAKAGGVIRAHVKAEIHEGWHLYSLKKISGGPIATRITLAEGATFSLAGEIEGSEPEVVNDSVFEMEVEYYSDVAEFVIPLRIATGAKGEVPLQIAARYQSCSEKVCLPPRTVVIETMVRIEDAK